ncbi:hypothetical protein XACS582_14260003 [Xanthomonas citri pv. citri]|nr:hypothetical protein XACS584_1840009 [Xanthomonas citri pv. citri]CEH60288.1 hypothetical protein XACS582_14260003 [Xanthomonas citri pv. citri]CEI02958.1 hypothetical protein XACS581_3440021 [Xanthomonas citri pv. citri]
MRLVAAMSASLGVGMMSTVPGRYHDSAGIEIIGLSCRLVNKPPLWYTRDMLNARRHLILLCAHCRGIPCRHCFARRHIKSAGKLWFARPSLKGQSGTGRFNSGFRPHFTSLTALAQGFAPRPRHIPAAIVPCCGQ